MSNEAGALPAGPNDYLVNVVEYTEAQKHAAFWQDRANRLQAEVVAWAEQRARLTADLDELDALLDRALRDPDAHPAEATIASAALLVRAALARAGREQEGRDG